MVVPSATSSRHPAGNDLGALSRVVGDQMNTSAEAIAALGSSASRSSAEFR
jgi:hypothetical protein